MKDKAYISYSSKDSSIQLLFCYSLNLWSWRDIVHYSYSSISISLPGHSFFYSVFHANCQFAVVWKEQSHFLLSLLFSWSSWECMWIEDLIIGWHSSCFSVSWSLRLPRSLAFILASFFAPPHHLISSEDEDWWRYFLFFFPSPCCWVLSLPLCPTKRLITVLPFLCCCFCEWRAERERERENRGRYFICSSMSIKENFSL